MWTCPDCGSEFKNTNQWHSCGKWTVEQFLEGRSATGVALYHDLEETLLKLPGVNVRPVKTRILFRCRAAFVSVENIGEGYVDLTFGLRRSAAHDCIRKVFREMDELMGHAARVRSADDIESLLPLLDESRVAVGGGAQDS